METRNEVNAYCLASYKRTEKDILAYLFVSRDVLGDLDPGRLAQLGVRLLEHLHLSRALERRKDALKILPCIILMTNSLSTITLWQLDKLRIEEVN